MLLTVKTREGGRTTYLRITRRESGTQTPRRSQDKCRRLIVVSFVSTEIENILIQS